MWVLLLACCLQHIATSSSYSNIVLILTDDQDLMLGGLLPMVKTQKLIANQGATFTNAFATTPICCPSRSSILTGKYLHNHGTVNNSVSGGCSSSAWQKSGEKETFATFLQARGYSTFYAGKYLNQYGYNEVGGPQHIPPGWDWWIGLVGNSKYYNYTLSINGTAKYYSDYYLTDVIKSYGMDFLNQKHVENSNFLMVLAPPAPHAPFIPAPQYKDTFKDVKVLHSPNFNIAVHEDRHWLLRMSPSPLPGKIMPTLDAVYRQRWETLLSVDDLVDSVVKQLSYKNLLSNTYVILTSDHGYHIGQFALPWDKRQPYESDIKVPLLIRGPGISKKKLIMDPVLNIDLAPTFLEIAGLPSYKKMDGKSFFHLLNNSGQKHRKYFLVEYRGEGNNEHVSPECDLTLDNNLFECYPETCCKCQDAHNNTFTCIRHLDENHNFIYCIFHDLEGFIEAYDIHEDPYQLKNLAKELDENRTSWYRKMLAYLSSCKGEELCHIV